MKILNLLEILLLLSLLGACVNENDLDPIVESEEKEIVEEEVDEVVAAFSVPENFDYGTTKDFSVHLQAPEFLNGAVFNLYAKMGDSDSLAIGKGTFNSSGQFNKTITASKRVDSLLIFSNYIGLVDNIRVAVNGNQVEFDYRPLYDRTDREASKTGKNKTGKGQRLVEKSGYIYNDTFNHEGVPQNMAFPDVVQQNLLDDLNASLPEGHYGGIPVTHPEFLAGKETNLIITEEADVWVTFVSEGAGYRNVLGYYTYPVGNPPSSVGDIDGHHIVFPNVSMVGSGGGLVPGDRVYLGKFPANTVVSWFLIANGWNGSGAGNGNGVYYSNPDFNPEAAENKRNHMVLLNDEARELTILGFEDLFREGGSDDDFNDAVFYAKANPPEAIEVGNLATITAANDADGDGINDELDDFPFDVDKAFNNYAPSVNSSGKLVYEDLWPSQGDYDFNDLVLEYSFNLIANANNEITAIDGEFYVEHIGASFHNGLAFQLPINPNAIAGVTGQLLNGGWEEVAENGTETGTLSDETIIIVTGDTHDLQGESISLSVEFNDAFTTDALGSVPFNMFLIVNGDRQREVHLPDLQPTSKASGYLATSDDYSDVTKGRYYKSKHNLPWALNIYDNFVAPPESVPISFQYPRFVSWANSGGTQDQDWFIRID